VGSRLHRVAWREFYVNDLYMACFARPFRTIAPFLWRQVDDRWIDGAVTGVGRAAVGLGVAARAWQSGRIRTYVASMLVGAALIAAILFLLAW
jgi:NADH:ubiquinone oxidoreductase subunit 5 (subunit L)/multisubunit Na+/H+ antiporter MnhA subunit